MRITRGPFTHTDLLRIRREAREAGERFDLRWTVRVILLSFVFAGLITGLSYLFLGPLIPLRLVLIFVGTDALGLLGFSLPLLLVKRVVISITGRRLKNELLGKLRDLR